MKYPARLSPNQASILWSIVRLQVDRQEGQGVTLHEIAEASGLGYSTVKENLARLELREVIAREATGGRGRAYRYLVLIRLPRQEIHLEQEERPGADHPAARALA